MTQTVITLNGEVINIGPWDFKIDDDGVIQNPMPAGAIEEQREVVEMADGGKTTADNYGMRRSSEYPSIREQLDMQYWDAINGTTTWADTIKAIKDKYPK